jgi:hypothetical protein
MQLKRLLLLAIGVGAVVALVATISVNILLPWSVDVRVLDAPQEQVARLNATELNDKLLSGALHLKSVRRAEKAMYLVTEAPMVLVHSWAYFFVASSIAAFLCGLLVTRRAA